METAPRMENEIESGSVRNGREWLKSEQESLKQSLPAQLARLWEERDPDFFIFALRATSSERGER